MNQVEFQKNTIYGKTFEGEPFMFRMGNGYLRKRFAVGIALQLHACGFILVINQAIIGRKRFSIE